MDDVQGLSGERLKSFVERIERVADERDGLTQDIKSIYDEAASTGFDKKIIRKIISLRKKDRQEREEEEELIRLYATAIGME